MSGRRALLMIAGGAAIVVLAFVATTYVLDWLSPVSDNTSVQTSKPATPSGSTGGIIVRSATYGASCGVKAGNATESVQSACGGKANCDYVVDVGKLGDPAPGCGKDFSVEYACGANSAAKTATAPAEATGSSVHLSCP